MWQRVMKFGGGANDIIYKNVSLPAGSNDRTLTIEKPKNSDRVLLITIGNSGYTDSSSYNIITDGIAELSILETESIQYSGGPLRIWSISNIQSETVTIKFRINGTAGVHAFVFQTTE